MEVSPQKFEQLRKESILLDKCPLCRTLGGKIEILMPCYGRSGVRVACINPKCEYYTKYYSYSEFFTANERCGSFTTKKSLMKAIMKAIKDWSGKSKRKEQK